MRFTAFDAEKNVLQQQVFYSVGGGFIVTDEQFGQESADEVQLPYPFKTAEELLRIFHKFIKKEKSPFYKADYLTQTLRITASQLVEIPNNIVDNNSADDDQSSDSEMSAEEDDGFRKLDNGDFAALTNYHWMDSPSHDPLPGIQKAGKLIILEAAEDLRSSDMNLLEVLHDCAPNIYRKPEGYDRVKEEQREIVRSNHTSAAGAFL